MRMLTLPRPALRSSSLALLAAGALAVAGCGGDDDGSTTSTSAKSGSSGSAVQSVLAENAPATAIAFGEVNIRPGGDTKAAIDEITGMFGVSDPGTAIRKGLELDDLDNLVPKGQSFENDVLPLIGDRLGAYLLPSASEKKDADVDFSLVGEVKDAEKLKVALKPTKSKTVTVDGQEIVVESDAGSGTPGAIWVTDDRFFLGTETAVRAAIAAAKTGDLASNDRFSKALAQIKTTDALGVAWFDLKAAKTLQSLLDRADVSGKTHALKSRAGGLGGSLTGELDPMSLLSSLPEMDQTVAVALAGKPGALRIAAGGTVAKTDGKSMLDNAEVSAKLVADLPAGTWLGFGFGLSGSLSDAVSPAQTVDVKDLAAQLEAMVGIKLDPKALEAFDRVKSLAFSGRGDSILGIGANLNVQAANGDDAKLLLDAVKSAAARVGLQPTDAQVAGTDAAFSAQFSGFPIPLAAGIKGDRFAIGAGTDALARAFGDGARLKDDAGYKEAKAALGQDPVLLLDVRPLGALIGSLPGGLANELPGFIDVLSRVKFLAASQTKTGDETWSGSLVLTYDKAARSTAPNTNPGGATGTASAG